MVSVCKENCVFVAFVIVKISLQSGTLFCIFLYLLEIYIVLPELWTSQNCQNPSFCMLSCLSWCPEFSRLFSASVIVEIIMPCCSGGTIILMFTTWGKNNNKCYMLLDTRLQEQHCRLKYILLIYHIQERRELEWREGYDPAFSPGLVARAFSRGWSACLTMMLMFG